MPLERPPWFAGLMSGTSLDGVDGVLAEITGDHLAVRAHVHHPFEPALRAELLALNAPGGHDELHRSRLAANAVARAYAGVLHALCEVSGVSPQAVAAAGAHGQTVRHQPGAFDGTGYTVQLLDAALLAELSGIDIVADLRSRDVAAGGQGAPLVPAFHAQRFAETGTDVAVLNLGGIGNLTLLPAEGEVRGFDTGPGNALMDAWIERHRSLAFDADGTWAAGGRVDEPWLAQLLAEPYFARRPPKSTGRDLFHAQWLAAHAPGSRAPQDVMATLAELTVRSATEALLREAPHTTRLWVCGGGAFNGHLMRRLQARLPGMVVRSSAEAGLPPDQVEALAFAWLAWAHVTRRAGNLPAVTGARGKRVLGALYPR